MKKKLTLLAYLFYKFMSLHGYVINVLSGNFELDSFSQNLFAVCTKYCRKYFFYISFQINNFALSTICCSFLAVCLCLAIKLALFRLQSREVYQYMVLNCDYMSNKCLKYHYLFIFQHKVLLISYSVSLYDKIEQ